MEVWINTSIRGLTYFMILFTHWLISRLALSSDRNTGNESDMMMQYLNWEQVAKKQCFQEDKS